MRDIRVSMATQKVALSKISIDAFIEKAKGWFKEQNEWFDMNGIRHYDMSDFEDFKKYMKGE